MFPDVLPKPPLMQLWTIPTRPITGSQEEEISASLAPSPPQEAAESHEVAPQPPFLQTRQAPESLATPHRTSNKCTSSLLAWLFGFFCLCFLSEYTMCCVSQCVCIPLLPSKSIPSWHNFRRQHVKRKGNPYSGYPCSSGSRFEELLSSNLPVQRPVTVAVNKRHVLSFCYLPLWLLKSLVAFLVR